MRPTQPVSKTVKPRKLGNSRYAPRAKYRTLYGVDRIGMLPSPLGLCNSTCKGSSSKFALYRLPNC
eukprot:9695224-Heterocapsa_arctica.AAC.1